jgi:hypothetical protein
MYGYQRFKNGCVSPFDQQMAQVVGANCPTANPLSN